MVEKIKGKDMTEFEGPVDTGDSHGKRPADKKKVGDMEADTSVSKKGKYGTELPSTTTIGEEVAALFEGVEGLSEDFTEKAAIIFEGAVSEKVSIIREEIEAEYNQKLDEAYDVLAEDLEDKLDQYLNLFVENYFEQNAVAIEKGFRSELAEAVLENVVSIVESAGIDLSEEKVDVAEALASENEELQEKYNASIHENLELKKIIHNYQLAEAFVQSTEGLTEGAKDKLRKLTENMEFADVDSFKKKISILKESFDEGSVDTSNVNLSEASEERPEVPVNLDPRMSRYIQAARGFVK